MVATERIAAAAQISCRYARSICTACFVVWRPRLAADTSTNRPQDFLCLRTASMEHAADTAEPAAVEHYFSLPTGLFQSAYGHRETD